MARSISPSLRARDAAHLYPERTADSLGLTKERFRIRRCIRIEQEPDVRDVRGDLLEQFWPLAAQGRFVRHEAGDVATRARQIGDEATADRIGNIDEDHRDRTALTRERGDADRGLHDDHVGLLLDDLLGHPRTIDFAGHPAIVGADVVPGGPAEDLQSLAERLGVPLSLPVVRTPHPYCDLSRAPGLLCARSQRPRRCRAAEKRDELAPFQLTKLHPLPQTMERQG